MADIDLPVWTIRPNWRGGILERLSWMTDVLPSTYGPEQRRALRLSPRRTFEITFNPVGRVRSFFDLWLHRMAADEFMLPLFHDKGKLSTAVEIAEDVIPVDTTFREFEAGGLALIMGEDPFIYDKLEIISVDAGSLTVEAPGVGNSWPAGSAIYPLRRTHLSEETALAALTSRVGQAVLAFELNQSNDIADEGEWPLLYNGHPVLLEKPNWREVRDMSFIRNMLILDNDHGLKTRQDDAGRAFTMQVHNRMMRGRADHWAFRQFLYRLRGQQGPIWLPTFNEDIEVAAAHVAANTVLRIKNIGYMYTGGLVSGRHHLLIGDSITRAIIDAEEGLTATEEQLTLSAALGVNVAAGTKGSFMEPCRLSTDDIEIVHHTDTDGTAECNLSFRSFRDEREEDPNIDNPIPEAVARNYLCGNVPIDWTLKLTIRTVSNPPWNPEGYKTNRITIFRSPNDSPIFPNGKQILAGVNITGNVRDNDYPDGSPGNPMYELKRFLGRTEIYFYWELPRPFVTYLIMDWGWGSFNGDGSFGSATGSMDVEWAGEDPYTVVSGAGIGEVFQQHDFDGIEIV